MSKQVIPYGYCHCGCGQKTNISTHTNTRLGYVKGKPYPFLKSHALRRPVADRFWPKVDRSDASGCWGWRGKIGARGYGRFYLNGKWGAAHRIAYALTHGPIPDAMVICHSCDNPSCVNPAHLFVGTQGDNVRDMINKGRGNPVRGESVNTAKLTEADVRSIRKIAMQSISHVAIAREYNVSSVNIDSIVLRKSWKHVD